MFYTFYQNNSGGGFDFNLAQGISALVIVEATSTEHALGRSLGIGLYFNGVNAEIDCPCCGDRWSTYDAKEGTDQPTIYGKSLEEYEAICVWMSPNPEGFVHYLDGRVEPFFVKKEKRLREKVSD